MATTVVRQMLVEKHRPTSLDNYVFQDKHTEKLVRRWVEDVDFPNVMLSGSPGTGKSTLARILTSLDGINRGDVKVVNGSTTNGVDFVRNELEPWMKRSPIGKFKVVLIEEADRFSSNGQDALRDITESYSDEVRFIITCNHPKRISEALQSRFEAGRIHLDTIDQDGVLNLVLDILEAEEIHDVTEEALFSHIDAYNPDIRKIINSIDKHRDGSKLLPLEVKQSSSDFNSWLEKWEEEHHPDWKWEDLLPLTEAVDSTNYEDYFEVMYLNLQHYDNIASAVIRVADYLYKGGTVANHRMMLDACLYQIFEVDANE